MATSAWAEVELELECNKQNPLYGPTWHRIDIENKKVYWSGSGPKFDSETNKFIYNLEEQVLKITEITDKTITYKGKRKPLHHKKNLQNK